jgi:hypothetical protein
VLSQETWDKDLDFSDAVCNGARFTNRNLKDCNFSRAKLKKANFYGVRLSNVNFSGANLEGAKLFLRAGTGRDSIIRVDKEMTLPNGDKCQVEGEFEFLDVFPGQILEKEPLR